MNAMKIMISILVVVFLLLALLYGRPIIVGDGISYYALAISLVQDGDFNLKNQRRQLHQVMTPLNPTTGEPASLYSCGFGLLYAPFLYLSQTIAGLQPTGTEWQPYAQNKRFPFPHAFGIFAGTVLFGFLNLLVMYFLLVYKFNQAIFPALLTAILPFIGSPLIFYTFAMPSYSHGADAFLTTLIFSLVFLGRGMNPLQARLRNICLGLFLALSISLRNNNLVLAVPAIGGILYLQRNDGLKRLLLTLMEILAGALPILLVQISFNLSQYGSALATGYKVQLHRSFLFEMLFHPWAGMFVWAPLTIVGLIGLAAGTTKRDFPSIVSLITVGLVLISVSFQGNWWGGCSFGQRFVTHLYVFWVIGLFQIISIKKWMGILFSALPAVWTFFLFHLFFVNASSPEVKKLLDQNNCRRTPAEMMQWAYQDYLKYGGKNPALFWLNSANSGSYPTLQFIIRHRGQ
jgi:hypothetical protein